MKILVTGNLGFIASNLTIELLRQGHKVVGIDAYEKQANPNYLQEQISRLYQPIFKQIQWHIEFARDKILGEMPDVIFHLAAESHVDNCQADPMKAEASNIMGTMVVLECAREINKTKPVTVIHVSTDEVFGQLGENDPPFGPDTPYAPRSVYAATKAASDHIARAYNISYGLDVRITNCTNNFGKGQYHEKLIPRIVKLITEGKPVTVNGTGNQVRDWIHVSDHVRGLIRVMEVGKPGETYLFGGQNEIKNLEMIETVFRSIKRTINPNFKLELKHVDHRPHDDFRYAMDIKKTTFNLGWEPICNKKNQALFEMMIDDTVQWCYEQQINTFSRDDALHKLIRGGTAS